MLSAKNQTKLFKNLSLARGLSSLALNPPTAPIINNETTSTEKTFPVTNPADNSLVANVSDGTKNDFLRAIDAASKSFGSFSKTTARQRAELLYKYYELVKENEQGLAELITIENGKPLADSLDEVRYAASFLQWFAEEAPRLNGDVIPSIKSNLKVLTFKQPVGVCGLLTPWNFPAAMITRKLGPLLAAGNTAVIKPAAETPLTALALGHLAIKAGFPKGVINIVPTSQDNTPEIGKLVCEHPVVKKVSFTGSTAVGKILMKQLSGTMKKLLMELGGNAPFVVFEDADIEKAVEGLVPCKFRQSGQTCVCANRIFVHDSIYDKFAELLKQKVESFVVGNGLDKKVTHGPLIHEKSFEKVKSLVHDAKADGATVIAGGSPATDVGPLFYHPTILGEVTPKMKIFDEEIFGPVASLVRFKSEEDVINLANNAPVGLAGYFYSTDPAKIFRVAESLEVGLVGVNTGAISEASVPFGGIKESGMGREGSVYGIDDWVNLKSVIWDVA